MPGKGIDYFENSRRATYVQRQYAIDNPLKFAHSGGHCWGLTASEGSGQDTIKVARHRASVLRLRGGRRALRTRRRSHRTV